MRIEWRRDPRRILLPCLILPPYPVTDLTGAVASALIDTGSSVSGVASSVATALGLRRLGKRPLKSAQGEGQVERHAFRLGLTPNDVTGFPFVFEEVIGIELTDAFEFSALIGMDIIGQCDLELFRDARCVLRFGL